MRVTAKGYTAKRVKYISIKAEGQERFVRAKKLEEDYNEQSLASRILWKDTGARIPLDNESAQSVTTTSAVIIATATLTYKPQLTYLKQSRSTE